MTKADNRAAAKAYQAEQKEKRRAEQLERDVKADLEQLARFRHYFQRERKVWIDTTTLISAIDDVAERLTGDRTALHSGTGEKPKAGVNPRLLE